jgi:hypothetical protein
MRARIRKSRCAADPAPAIVVAPDELSYSPRRVTRVPLRVQQPGFSHGRPPTITDSKGPRPTTNTKEEGADMLDNQRFRRQLSSCATCYYILVEAAILPSRAMGLGNFLPLVCPKKPPCNFDIFRTMPVLLAVISPMDLVRSRSVYFPSELSTIDGTRSRLPPPRSENRVVAPLVAGPSRKLRPGDHSYPS